MLTALSPREMHCRRAAARMIRHLVGLLVAALVAGGAYQANAQQRAPAEGTPPIPPLAMPEAQPAPEGELVTV